MPKGKVKSTSFKPGQSGNPNGRPKIPAEVREIATHTKQDIINAYFLLSRLTPKQAEKYEPKTVLELGIIRCLFDFTRTGRTDQMRHIWAECHGKPRESVGVSFDNGIHIHIDSDDERL